MFSFRQKIFLSYVLVFLVFLTMMSPVASLIVKRIVENAMENRAYELISQIETAPNNEALIRRLKEQKSSMFFRVSVITNDRKILYDSHTKRLLGPRFSQEHFIDHPEVLNAFEKGRGYSEAYSDVLAQQFAYVAVAFDFHGKTYVMRTAFPFRYIKEIVNDFEVGFLVLATAVLVLFSLMTWFIINHLTKPVQNIISAVAFYEENGMESLPEIKSESFSTSDDIAKLAATLNSLSSKVKRQIDFLKQERNEKQVLLESMLEGVVAVDEKMMVTFINVAASKFLGLNRDEWIGRDFRQSEEMQCSTLLETCQIEEKPLTGTIYKEIDGTHLYLDIIAAPKNDNKGAILVMQDKSSHYKILEMRKDFVANASHELKTPITIIKGFAETLHDNASQLPLHVTKDVTEKIVRNCGRMETLIKDLLTLSDIENIPTSRLQECDLQILVEKCRSMVLAVYPDAAIQIKNPEPKEMFLVCDADLLEMAILNLIQNAVKYSNPPAQVQVSLAKTDDTIIMKVADQGIGIAPEDLGKIFERFYRVSKARSQRVGGSGLGLSIVETVIHKHFGKISVVSTLGKGTTFTITLPIRKAEQEEEYF
ncbi:Uncharacterized protein PHSC3_000750 [Chlamydiales bacterium STE3]|nr:Uncharacterized protein PHSC3_000750 [Chlamydiales bacterium STE3]